MMRTGEQYLQSLRDGRRVVCGGELIDDVTAHPKTRGYAGEVAEFYDLYLDPEHREHLTYVDEDGVRRAKHWMLPSSNNSVTMMLVDDPEPWEAQTVFGKGKPMADNIRRGWADLKDGEERKRSEHEHPLPDYVRKQDVETV